MSDSVTDIRFKVADSKYMSGPLEASTEAIAKPDQEALQARIVSLIYDRKYNYIVKSTSSHCFLVDNRTSSSSSMTQLQLNTKTG